jgi:hypothetical protein
VNTTPLKAVRARCRDCTGFDGPSAIRGCGGDGLVDGECPLWPFRLGKRPKGTSVLKAIRLHCLSCSGGSVHELRHCPATDCPLWLFRFGRNPFVSGRKVTDRALRALKIGRVSRKKASLLRGSETIGHRVGQSSSTSHVSRGSQCMRGKR